MWPWNCLSWSCDALDDATTFINSFNAGSAAARVASIWITGSVLPFCGGATDGVDGDCGGRPLLPDDGGLGGAPGVGAVFAGVAGGG
jgi:hypothetical protein